MKKSYLIASAFTLAITGWMLAGYFATASKGEAVMNTQAVDNDLDRMLVEVRTLKAKGVARHIVSQGQVEPNREVTVVAETEGRVAEVVAEEGWPVKAGDVLVRLEMNDRQTRLEKEEALLRERQKVYEGTKKLGDKGYQAQRQIDESYSLLQAARAALAEIKNEISNTTVRAPFDGILEMRRVEVGSYVAINGDIATIVDNDPLVVTVQISQQDIGKIALGDIAVVAFATGQKGEGVLKYIAPRAEESTRTFRVEIRVPNPDNRILSGTSAEARIPTGTIKAHFLSTALLALNDAGVIGVKAVTETDNVVFHPVTIVLAEADGVWVSGLPDEVRIIAVGQGFVQEGEAVRTISSKDMSPAPGVAQTNTMLSQDAPGVIERVR